AAAKHSAGARVDVTVVIERAGKTGHDSHVTGNVLIEFTREAVVVLLLTAKQNRRAIESGATVLVERRGIVVRAFIGITCIEFITGIVPVLRQRCRRTNQSYQEQEKDSGHRGASLSVTLF